MSFAHRRFIIKGSERSRRAFAFPVDDADEIQEREKGELSKNEMAIELLFSLVSINKMKMIRDRIYTTQQMEWNLLLFSNSTRILHE